MFYLTKIARTYYCRFRIPKDLHKFFPQKEIKKSLRTCRYKSAKSSLLLLTSKAEGVFTLLRSGTLTDDGIKKIVEDFLDHGVTFFESTRDQEIAFASPDNQELVETQNALVDHIIATDEGLDMLVEAREVLRGDAKRQLARKKGPDYPFVENFAESYIKRHGLKVDASSPQYAKLCNELLKASIKLDRVISEHLLGNYETDYDAELRNKKKVKTFKELIELYEKEKDKLWKDKSRFLSTHRQLLHIIGDIRLDQIDRALSVSLQAVLPKYPRNLRNVDLSIPWETYAKSHPGRLSEGSQKFILTQYCTLLKYAKDNGYGIEGNPAKGLVDKKSEIKRKKVRERYSSDELRNLISILALLDRKKEPEVFWIPLLLLFTGARSNEICMLRCCDLECHDGVWVICFRNRKEHHQRTKNGKDRQAPIHRVLIDLGFLDFVCTEKGMGKDRLFSNLTLYREKWNVQYGKDFNRTFKRKFLVGYTKERLNEKDLHTFRGTLISWFVDHPEFMTIPQISLLQSIIGHYESAELTPMLDFLEKSKLTLIDYGGGFGKSAQQNELLQRLDYGVDFSPLKLT